jgi:hypothetical protein
MRAKVTAACRCGGLEAKSSAERGRLPPQMTMMMMTMMMMTMMLL